MKQKFYFMKVVVAVFGCMGALTTLFWMIAALEGVNLLSELAKSSILGKISLATMFGGMILTPFLWIASLIVDLQKKQTTTMGRESKNMDILTMLSKVK
jgi:hypothetical protein